MKMRLHTGVKKSHSTVDSDVTCRNFSGSSCWVSLFRLFVVIPAALERQAGFTWDRRQLITGRRFDRFPFGFILMTFASLCVPTYRKTNASYLHSTAVETLCQVSTNTRENNTDTLLVCEHRCCRVLQPSVQFSPLWHVSLYSYYTRQHKLSTAFSVTWNTGCVQKVKMNGDFTCVWTFKWSWGAFEVNPGERTCKL